jgi:hypothetical protein
LLQLRDAYVGDELRKYRNWVFATTGCALNQKANTEVAREALRRVSLHTERSIVQFSDGALSRDWRSVVEHYLAIREESVRMGIAALSEL